MLLSSHLLDEVEKTCDVAAIVDSGRVVAQGTIGELVGGGPRAIDVVCHGPAEVVRAARRGARRDPRGRPRGRDPRRRSAPRRRSTARSSPRCCAACSTTASRSSASRPSHVARRPLPDHDHPPRGPILMLDLRLISAEVLKLRRRRGMLAIAGVLDARARARRLRRDRASSTRSDPRQVRPRRRRCRTTRDGLGVLAPWRSSSARSSAAPPARRTSSPACSATWPPPAARGWRCSARG